MPQSGKFGNTNVTGEIFELLCVYTFEERRGSAHVVSPMKKGARLKCVVLARHECQSDLLSKEKKDRRGPNYMYIPTYVGT